MFTKIRIGNIEYRETRYLDGKGTYEEIVRWFPNGYYGKRESMLNDGYVENGNGSLTKENFTVDGSCFENPETCCSVATIIWNNSHDEFDVKSVGTRAFDLDETDRKNFMKTLRLIEETNA